SLNGSPYVPVNSANGWTNWNETLQLQAGTNLLSVYALATNNNAITDNVAIVYAVSNQLQLQISGRGTVSPNYSNAWLRLGQNYSMTAVPNYGFIFTNWVVSTNFVGALATNKPTLQFQMATNLTLQVNFTETARPTLTVLSPISGAREPGSAALTGAARDIWGIATVAYQLNGGAWTNVATTNGFTNWNTTVQLSMGTNVLKIYALNLGGNYSPTNSLSLLSTNVAMAMQFGLVSRPPGGHGFNINLALAPGISGRIEVSTNLIDWNVLTNFTETNGVVNIFDPDATTPQRFYRAVVP
ncbi:MAG TPA: Ig-like domain-containing protein, partial [Verrucomicrobiae bacterium]|nr:Ig-like domain-containing protein [Verrucomicrobiae bacterium]